MSKLAFLTLGAHAQRGLLTGLFVCLSVTVSSYSGTTGFEAAYERYQWVQNYAKLNIKKKTFLKRLRSRDMP